ncbi:MAG TPA: helix-hairpin-helix domain-containing protein [Kiritimatiellia bacterium]|nr:helix-hairpin-helix domain-containing protein [Kiritimatiellia bacterium]
MKTFLNVKLVVVIAIAISFSLTGRASDLIAYENARLVDHGINDGDSFFVDVGGNTLHIRLYFVDTPETEIHQLHDARRVQEQARYFGIEQPERVMKLGEQASDYTRNVLSKPFTVYTSHAKALGGAGSQRIYGFIVTAEGRDLGELLVENGLGRNFGVKRERYDGLSHVETELRLRDMEISAMLSNRGVWSESNPHLIVEYRARQREEAETLRQLMSSAVRLLEEPLNINDATQRDLERIPGIGPVMASRIIEKRPYRSLDELRGVHGIGDKLLESILPYIQLASPAKSNG